MQIIKTKSRYIHLKKNSIILVKSIDLDEQETLEMAQENLEALRSLIEDKNRAVLLYPPKHYLSTEVQEFYRSNIPIATAIAFISTSFAQTMLANFFLTIRRPTIPIKLFKEEEQAEKWLLHKISEKLVNSNS